VAARPLLGAVLALEAVLLLALPAATWAAAGAVEPGPGRLGTGLGVAALLGGPPLLVGALVFPLTFRLAAGGAVGRRLGGLLAANTLGGIAGSLAASFVLLDGLGLWASLAALGLGYGAAALLVDGDGRERALRAAPIALATLGVFATRASPAALPVVALEPGDRLVAVDQGASGVVSVIDGPLGRRMKLNNHYTLSGAGRLQALKERAGHVPLLLHPAPRRVAFVGSATGGAAGAAVLHPVEEIALVEIVPEVQDLAARWFGEFNHRVYDDPRTRRVVEDGRNHLRATRARYDVIVADLFSPWNPGIGALYAREHFEAVRRRLAPGGVFCQWLPLYQHSEATFAIVAATFADVFPDATVWRSDFYARTLPSVALCGFEGDPPAIEIVDARVRELAAGGAVADRWVTDPRGFWMLYAGPLSGARDWLAGAPRNSDAHPVFDYVAGRDRAIERQAFLRTRWPALAERLLAGGGDGHPLAPALPRARDGAVYAEASAANLDGRQDAFADAWRRLQARVPPELLRAPDPSVSEIWMSR
jgi:spermidine synthase